jgi:hypothetical protein
MAKRTPKTSPKVPVNSGQRSPNVGVAATQAAVVRDEHDRRERHSERREDDVEPEREGHLAAGRGQVRDSQKGIRDHGAHVGAPATHNPMDPGDAITSRG